MAIGRSCGARGGKKFGRKGTTAKQKEAPRRRGRAHECFSVSSSPPFAGVGISLPTFSANQFRERPCPLFALAPPLRFHWPLHLFRSWRLLNGNSRMPPHAAAVLRMSSSDSRSGCHSLSVCRLESQIFSASFFQASVAALLRAGRWLAPDADPTISRFAVAFVFGVDATETIA